jgi:hypothetical protein
MIDINELRKSISESGVIISEEELISIIAYIEMIESTNHNVHKALLEAENSKDVKNEINDQLDKLEGLAHV